MADALLIELVEGWSIHLFERHDPTMPWHATATRDNEVIQASGVDREMALVNIAKKCGIDREHVLQQFGR